MPSFPGKVSKEVDRVRDAFRRGAQARQSDFDIKRVQDLIAQEHRNDSPNLINLAYLYDVLRGVVTSSGFKKYGDITIPDVVFDAFDANQDTDVPVEINFVWNIAVLHARGFVAVSDASLGIMVKSQIQIVIRAAASQFNLYNVVNALAVLRMCLQDDIGADDRVAILSVVNKVIENFVPGNAIYYRFGSPKLIEFLYALRFFIDILDSINDSSSFDRETPLESRSLIPFHL